MSTLDLRRPHSLSAAECDAALAELDSFLASELGAQTTQSPGTLIFSGRGFAGEVRIEPGWVHGQVRLGLLARPLKRQLEDQINRYLDARLGGGEKA